MLLEIAVTAFCLVAEKDAVVWLSFCNIAHSRRGIFRHKVGVKQIIQHLLTLSLYSKFYLL